jgi:Uma2 family endonuclease
MIVPIERRRFTATDYARMHESGILAEDDRVELLDGEIYLMSPIGPRHAALVNRLNKLLLRQIGDDAILSIQNPIQLDAYSQPQPDLALLAVRADEYAAALPTPPDVLLLIEVADTSLVYDRQKKLPRYAAAQIPEVWIIDVDRQIIEQYAQPIDDQYTLTHTILLGYTITSATTPRIQITTDAIF